MGTLITVGIIVLVLLLLLGWIISSYNRLVRLRNRVEESWRQIDVELTRRHDLIPNLVETVKGYASHERGTLEEVMQARNQAAAPSASPAERAARENVLTGALRQLFAVAEAYPDLKANVNFQQLSSSLEETENRLANARRYYNAIVRENNTTVESFPTNIIAGLFKFVRAEYFEADEPQRQVPEVDFSTN